MPYKKLSWLNFMSTLRMKAWWLGMNDDIETTVWSCAECGHVPNAKWYPPLHLCAPGIGQHAVRLCWTHKRTNVLGADRRPFQYSLFKGTASFVCQVWATGRNSPCPRFEWASRTSGPNREATRLAKFLFALSVGTTGVSHA